MKEPFRNLIKTIKDDPSNYEALYEEAYDTLKEKFPKQDEYWLEYWAVRISLFEAGEFTIKFDTLPDPQKISLQIYPDYGS